MALYVRQLQLGPMENFVYLVGAPDARETAIVDPAWDVAAAARAAEEDGRVLTHALLSHHHFDHVNGVPDVLARGGIRVGIEAVSEASPMGRLRGTDNQVAIHSKRYKTNPLVVTGPGAGAAVTAAGVLNDIVAITLMEQRRR